MKCPNCYKEISSEWMRCPFCDYKPKRCSKNNCKSKWLPNEAHFCPLCGSPVKGEENLRIKEIIERTVADITSFGQTEGCSFLGNDLEIKVGNVIFKMIFVEGGSFLMGSYSTDSEASISETPQHEVRLGSFYMGETLVTQALWESVIGKNRSCWQNDSLPVEMVSWEDCQTFIKQLNKMTGKNFRLPTEAEWEYAARGGNKSLGNRFAGSDDVYAVAWFDKNSNKRTQPVMQKESNELGLYDMSGNLWEWCQDWYGDYSSSTAENPYGPSTGSARVLRGGSWAYDEKLCRVVRRIKSSPDHRDNTIGFRLVLVP